MFANILRDESTMPIITAMLTHYRDYLAQALETLMAGRAERGHARRRLRAAIGHALAFATWRSLAREQGLDNGETATLMCALVAAAGDSRGVSILTQETSRSPGSEVAARIGRWRLEASTSPFGARGLVRLLGKRGRGGPNLTGVLAEPGPGEVSLELANEGGETAAAVAYYLAGDDGQSSGEAGSIAPGGSIALPVQISVTRDPVECVWTCLDSAGRQHVWSYDGRHQRLARDAASSPAEQFRLMYRDHP